MMLTMQQLQFTSGNHVRRHTVVRIIDGTACILGVVVDVARQVDDAGVGFVLEYLAVRLRLNDNVVSNRPCSRAAFDSP